MEEEYVIRGLHKFGSNLLVDLSGIISVDCFTSANNQILFRCIETIVEDGLNIDLVSMKSAANKLGVELPDFDFNGGEPVSLNNAILYGKQLFKQKVIRKARGLVKNSFDKLGKFNGGEKLSEIISVIENPSYDILQEVSANHDENPVRLGEIASDYIEERIANPVEMVGIPTPWPKFNRAIGGGIRSGGVTLVAAPAKSGKTTFAKEVATFLSKTIPVLMIDTEMYKEEQLDRVLSSLSNVDIEKIETGKLSEYEKQAVRNAASLMEQDQFFHKSVAGFSFEQILSTIKRWVYKEVGLDGDGKANDCLVMYDYFKIMDRSELLDMKEHEAIYYNVSKITDFSKELDIPILSFVQLNREGQIAQSQRLEWICKSINYLYRKTDEEIREYPNTGTGKLVPSQMQRFGHNSLDPGDYINLVFDKKTNSIKEGETFFSIKNKVQQFVSEDDEEGEDVPF